MIKTAIGILDMNLDNISILNTLTRNLKSENLIYINDLSCPNYEGLEPDIILHRVKNNVDFLLKKNLKLLLVVSNTIIEYCREYFNSLPIPVVNIVDSIISSVNDEYGHKNMLLLAKNDIIKANMYQKYFEYNHLYNVASDKLDEIVIKNQTKTSQSFYTSQDLLKSFIKKDVNVIIPTTTNLEYLGIEFREYLPNAKLFSLSMNICEKVKAALLAIDNINSKGRGKVSIYININKKEVVIKHLIDVKHHIYVLKNTDTNIIAKEEKTDKKDNKKLISEVLKIDVESEEARANLNKAMLGKIEITDNNIKKRAKSNKK